jgi:hypothetical protein
MYYGGGHCSIPVTEEQSKMEAARGDTGTLCPEHYDQMRRERRSLNAAGLIIVGAFAVLLVRLVMAILGA